MPSNKLRHTHPWSFSQLKLIRFVAFLALFLGSSCTNRPRHLSEGPWRASLNLGGPVLPFTFDLASPRDSAVALLIHNGQESIRVSDILVTHDSLIARLPVFGTDLRCRILDDSTLSGVWVNLTKGPAYRIPFEAKRSSESRFLNHDAVSAQAVLGSWEVHFSGGTTDAYNAIGLFEARTDGCVTGTFLTETGDYRYLEGAVHSDTLFLSCFDGSHAFLFKAAIRGDSLLGRFWSGTHWQEPWVAIRNAHYSLRDPDELTHLRQGYDSVNFRFVDTEGIERSPSDADMRGRPLLVHIMGSWCPNCADESVLLKEMHQKYAEKGLRILAVAFEKQTNEKSSIQNLRRFKQELGLPYPVLLGGPAAKDEASARLPFLNRLISYPTCIFIDKRGRVRRIRTGFYGPGTGAYYHEYAAKLDSFVQALVSEP